MKWNIVKTVTRILVLCSWWKYSEQNRFFDTRWNRKEPPVDCVLNNSGRLMVLRFRTHRKSYTIHNTSINNTAQIFLWLFSQYFISLVSPRYTNLWYTSLWRGASIIMHKITFFQSPWPVCYPTTGLDSYVGYEICLARREMVLPSPWFHFTANFQDFTLKMISTTGSALICNTQ